MKHTLQQSDLLLNRRMFEITDLGLSVKESSLLKSNDYTVQFEKIGTKRLTEKSIKKGWLIATAILFLLAIGLFIVERTGGDAEKGGFVVYLIFGIITGLITVFTSKHFLYLATNDNQNAIEFLLNKPSREELHTFIDELITFRNDFLVKKYFPLEKSLSYEHQFDNLVRLSEMGALSKDEYAVKLQELNNLFSHKNEIRGFKFGGS